MAVVAQETTPYSHFALSLAQLELPPGWKVEGCLGGDVVHQRNLCVAGLDTDYLLFLDDDHTFRPTRSRASSPTASTSSASFTPTGSIRGR